ncbi:MULTISPECIES: hypothetical protein [unclassified Nostoc]|uniref:hypothetical protein n=1 Tax=unclassified Nostoc TaxID=2593658 RepID=UPI002AD47A5B|nr:hypothetical protein [Nostoc sp. DedQUE03]MDZ7973466.1 hypothetical protein [Nostoc sp. DedQUE03]MDZ8045082.1 hypothetical protein [Nostoc sp. DedQUE02]
MTNNTKIIYEEKLKSLAQKYESQGFQVLTGLKTDELPFDLGNYQPDLIAIKDGSGLVIEVKNSLSRLSVDRLQVLAKEVSKHPGWRFLLVTLEDIEAKSLPGTSEELPSWQELKEQFDQAHKLTENEEIQSAFLLLWSIFEGVLRKRAIDVSIPIERFPVIGLIKHMYSLGELSISQFDLVQACFEVNNRLAHGYIENLNLPLVCNLDNLVSELLTEWKIQFDVSQLSSEGLAAFRTWFVEFDVADRDKPQELSQNLFNLILFLSLGNEKLNKELNVNDKQLINVELDVSQLLPKALAAFRAWFAEFDAAAWDKQIEEDVAAGRLDVLAEKALKHLREGRCTDL